MERGRDTEMAEGIRRDGGRPTHTRGTPEQTGARSGAHMFSKQVVLATNDLDVTCKDASRIHGSVPPGLMARSATYCSPCAPRAHQLVHFIEHAAVIINEDWRGYMMSTTLRLD